MAKRSNFLTDSDSWFNRGLSRLFDILLLGVITTALCIPVITIGAAITANMDIMLRIALKKENKIIKGSRIKFTGTKSYSGIKLASWTHNDIFNVIELSGDRVVIGKGSAVTAAVNIRDCQKV